MSYVPMELLRELLGFAQVTFSKKHESWSKRSDTSRPRKILATKLPPGLRTCNVICNACGSNNQSCSTCLQRFCYGQPAAIALACIHPGRADRLLWCASVRMSFSTQHKDNVTHHPVHHRTLPLYSSICQKYNTELSGEVLTISHLALEVRNDSFRR